MAVSDNPFAQQAQEFVGCKQDRIILDSAFSVGPAYVSVLQIRVAGRLGECGRRRALQLRGGCCRCVNRKSQASEKSKDASGDTTVDNNIEVYVLTDAAFTVWQNGYATSSIYESGKVAEGTVQADVPAGAGIYYLVFSNKAAPKTPKAIHATVCCATRVGCRTRFGA